MGLTGKSEATADNPPRETSDCFQAAFRSNPVPMLVARIADGTYLGANRAGAEMLGRPLDEVIGRTSRELGVGFGEGDRQAFTRFVKRNGGARGFATLDSYPGPLGERVINLVNNALVHGFERIAAGTVRIEVRAEAAGRVLLTVADHGRGIAPGHLGRAFDPFFTMRLGQGGSGLGLHIVYNSVTGVPGGRIDVESGPPGRYGLRHRAAAAGPGARRTGRRACAGA